MATCRDVLTVVYLLPGASDVGLRLGLSSLILIAKRAVSFRGSAEFHFVLANLLVFSYLQNYLDNKLPIAVTFPCKILRPVARAHLSSIPLTKFLRQLSPCSPCLCGKSILS